MTFSKIMILPGSMAAAVLFAVCTATPARAQAAPTVLQTSTSPDGLLTLVLSSTNPSDAVGVNNTYTWTAINNSATVTLTGVILGSHWGDYCPACVSPVGPTLISMAPGCSGQGADEIPPDAHFGVWCTPLTGATLPPGQSVSGSVTLRPGSGGPPDYGVYSAYNDPKTGAQHLAIPRITQASVVAPAATDIQITGAASNGAPPAGSTFTYTYQVKNAGPWGTYGGIIFVDTLPASLTYVDSFVTVFSPFTLQPVEVQWCNAVGQTVACPLVDLQNGGATGQVTVTLTVTASSVAQQIVNTASVHTVLPQTDSNPANNSVTVSVTTK
ncbi:MAG TPA: DUF11 domain-containing protein [Candidatus Acidoferrales bacterium]|jgi:uncharacterized repeat protein (TIGR01451 family)|nr:DUF11 domain-containing protein [Candidatus Acidoferrales bacterium]